ncbi:MAG: hypothetical protein SangKO_042030 [Sandaracinaceae bacterium]
MEEGVHRVIGGMRASIVALGLLCASAASAQDAPEPSEWRLHVARGRAALAAERWVEAAAAFDEANDAWAGWGGTGRLVFACDVAVASVRTESERSRSALADAMLAPDPEVCLPRLVDALRAAGRVEEACVMAIRARAAGADVDDAYAQLDPVVRARVEAQLARLQSAPLARAVPPAASPDALAAEVARTVWMARPTRVALCSPVHDPSWGGPGWGVITCSYSDAPEPYAFGNRYPLESFVYERARGRLRTVASFAAGASFDCENGHLEPVRSSARLTRRRHGVDGWLLRERDAWEWDDYEVGQRRQSRDIVWACTRESGGCARVEEAAERCVTPERGSPTCSERYRGRASVRRGALTIRIDEGELPEALRRPVDLTTLRPSSGASALHSARVSMRGCHVEVHDDRPPLNVRAAPSARAAVVGTLEEGTRVTPQRGRRAGWVQITAPLTGWVWVANLRRVCAGDAAPSAVQPTSR